MKLNFVVGRFQPLHNDHVKLIRAALNENTDKTVIFIGCSEQDGKDQKNPFTFEERASILAKEFLPEMAKGLLSIFKVNDEPLDILWLQNIKNTLQENYPNYKDIKAFVVDKDLKTKKSNDILGSCFTLKRLKPSSSLSATNVRELLNKGIISKDIPQSTVDFLLTKFKGITTCSEILCPSCVSDKLLPVEKEQTLTVLSVYEINVIQYYLKCPSCSAIYEAKADGLTNKDRIEQTINQLYYQ